MSSSRLTSHLQNGVRSLAKLEDVEQLSPRVWRILAQNSGAYTLQGTCTYLVGTGRKRLLIDTGDAHTSEKYISVLESCFKLAGNIDGLDGIVITHWHHDHLGGVHGLQRKFGPGIPVYKNIPDVEEPGIGDGEMAISAYQSYPKEGFTPIVDGQYIRTEGASLRAIHAPGHANDLCAFTLDEEPGSMFTSDNVLGEGTGVIVNLSQYLSSLRKMRALNPTRLYPGHGKHVDDGSILIDEYISHRMKRVVEVLTALETAKGAPLTLEQLTSQVYGTALPKELFGPAMYNVKMALEVLIDEGKCEGTSNQTWRAKI
jgi:ribonuclease/clavin/mitogillin